MQMALEDGQDQHPYGPAIKQAAMTSLWGRSCAHTKRGTGRGPEPVEVTCVTLGFDSSDGAPLLMVGAYRYKKTLQTTMRLLVDTARCCPCCD